MSQLRPFVSIITPVFNGEKYLQECIESVIAQTYSNWEYIIVDNCSRDRTSAIARHYAEKDSRIRVHENREFLPAIANHNHALRLTSPNSKYCKLIFADDWLFANCLELMVNLAEAYPSIGILNSYSLEGSEVMWAGLPYPSHIRKGRDVCKERLLGGPYVFGAGTSQMYRSEIVRSVHSFFNESNPHCDSEICFKHLAEWDFGFIHQILSYRRPLRPESLTTKCNQLNTLLAMTFYELMVYGQTYLTPEEQEHAREEKSEEYYSALAGYVLEGGEAWQFHSRKLAEFGVPIDQSRLSRAVIKKGMKALLKNPVAAFANIVNGNSTLSSRLPAIMRKSS